MANLDVVVVGGFAPFEAAGSSVRDKIRLMHRGNAVTARFLEFLLAAGGDLELARQRDSARQARPTCPLAAIYLFDFLTKQGLDVGIVGYFLLERERFTRLLRERPAVVAISTSFIFYPQEMVAIARAVREISPDSVIVAGGSKVLKSIRTRALFDEGYFKDAFDTEALEQVELFFNAEIDRHVDFFATDACGELTLLELVRRVKRGEDCRGLPNVAFRDGERLVVGERVPEPHTFLHHAISWDRLPAECVGDQIPVRAGLGCPHSCAFCDFAGLVGKARLRPVADVVEELRLVSRAFPGKPVIFTDDNLFSTRKRTQQLCEAMVQAGLQVKWRAFFRIDAVCESNVEWLARSGCIGCFLGVESGDADLLRAMSKRSTPADCRRAIQLLDGAGIPTISTLIVGFPGETPASVDNTIGLLNSYPASRVTPHLYYPFAFNPLPLAPAIAPAARARTGLCGSYSHWRHRTMDSDQAAEQMQRLAREVHSPLLSYPDYIDPDFGYSSSRLISVGRARDALQRGGLTQLGDDEGPRFFDALRARLGADFAFCPDRARPSP